jgi:hypothetical protein
MPSLSFGFAKPTKSVVFALSRSEISAKVTINLGTYVTRILGPTRHRIGPRRDVLMGITGS